MMFDTGKTFIVAELSANHNQKKELAIKTIRAAKKAGADAIKLQTYTPDTITLDCNNEYFQINHGTIWDGRTLYDLYKEAYTPWEWHQELFDVASEEGLVCFSSPFDKTAVDFLDNLGCPVYKVASLEITDIPLIRYIASKGKPVILSTGIARIEDIDLAINAIRQEGIYEIAVLKCTSEYPAPPEEANLVTIRNIAETFGVIPGLSDHTLGIEASIIAVAVGAKIIEKHFILDRSMGGPDSSFSLDPADFSRMVSSIRLTEKMLGRISYGLSSKLERIRQKGARSLFVSSDIKCGEVFTEDNIRSVRPGFGLHPKFYNDILGKKANKDLAKGTPLRIDDLM